MDAQKRETNHINGVYAYGKYLLNVKNIGKWSAEVQHVHSPLNINNHVFYVFSMYKHLHIHNMARGVCVCLYIIELKIGEICHIYTLQFRPLSVPTLSKITFLSILHNNFVMAR